MSKDLILRQGAIARTPAGREVRVLAVDRSRGEADVEALPWRAKFRTSTLTIIQAPDPAGDAASDNEEVKP